MSKCHSTENGTSENHQYTPKTPREKTSQRPSTKWWPILVLAIASISDGTYVIFPGIVQLQLTQVDSNELSMTTEEFSVYNSLPFMGFIPGICLSWPLQTIVGPRIVIILALSLNVTAWLTTTLTTKVWLLCLAHFAQGVSGGPLGPSLIIYIVETSHKNDRGWQSGMQYLFKCIGTLVPVITTIAKLNWRQTGLVCCVLSFVPILGLLLLPDSPRWLMTRGRNTDSQKALKYFRGDSNESESEYTDIVAQALQEGQGGICHQMKMLFRHPTRRTLGLLLVTSTITSFGGSILITRIIVPLLQMTQTTGDPIVISTVSLLLDTLGATVAVCFTHRLKRKPLTIVGFINISLSFGALSLYFFLQKLEISDIKWMPIAAIITMMFFDGIAFPGFYTLQGELLPLSCRATGNLLLKCVFGISAAVTLMTYEQTHVALGMDGAFLLYGTVAAIVPAIIAFCLLETHGVSLEKLTMNISQKDFIRTLKKDQHTVIT